MTPSSKIWLTFSLMICFIVGFCGQVRYLRCLHSSRIISYLINGVVPSVIFIWKSSRLRTFYNRSYSFKVHLSRQQIHTKWLGAQNNCYQRGYYLGKVKKCRIEGTLSHLQSNLISLLRWNQFFIDHSCGWNHNSLKNALLISWLNFKNAKLK